MAKFCPNCGAQMDAAAKFCTGCGTQTAAADAPEPQPEQQPVYQEQPYAPASAPKKKRTGLKILLGFVGAIVLLIVVIVAVLGAGGSKDYYKLGKDQIPSVRLALGEKRKLSGTSSSIENGATIKRFTYAEPGRDQVLEMSAYLKYLREKDGFLLLTDVDFSIPEAWCKVGRNSVDAGYQLVLQIEYDRSGYAITIVKEPGEITPNTSISPYDMSTTTPVNIPTTPAFGEPDDPGYLGEYVDPNTDWSSFTYEDQELWRSEDDESVELIFLNTGGGFEFFVETHWRGSGGQIDELSGHYTLSGGKLYLTDVTDGQGDAYNDITFDCKISGDVMTLNGDGVYHRVADSDRPYVLSDPFAPYPIGMGGP